MALAPAAALAQPSATAERAAAPTLLGVASNFGQGWSAETFAAATRLGARHFRDGMRWAEIEEQPGIYTAERARNRYPAELERSGASLVLVLAGANPHHDGGETPHSPAALDAFARYGAHLARTYPAIAALEVGNEFNSANFVTGPVREAGLAARGGHHLAQLRAVAAAVRAVRPGLPILGGAAHSIPAGYLWPILDRAEPGLLDGLTLHPYTTAVDELAGQVAVLRRHPGAARLPLHITEFGTTDLEGAPDHLVRSFAALASLGAASAYWYPLNERGDGTAPLIDGNGATTPAGEAFAFAMRELAGRPAQALPAGAFTRIHAFGTDRLVLWGEDRALRLLRDDIEAFDARGRPLDRATLALAPDRALVLAAPGIVPGDLSLGCLDRVADTRWQFSYEDTPGAAATPRFVPSIALDGRPRALVLMPGQQRPNTAWTPYLGLADRPEIRVEAGRAWLGGGADGAALVHQFAAPAAGRYTLEITAASDGAELSLLVTRGGAPVVMEARDGSLSLLHPLDLAAGETLAVAINRTAAENGALSYRLTLSSADLCTAPQRR